MKNICDAPIHVQKRNKDEIAEEAKELLKKMGLADKADYYPYQLSGRSKWLFAMESGSFSCWLSSNTFPECADIIVTLKGFRVILCMMESIEIWSISLFLIWEYMSSL